ncbi:MAG: PH domain-containing protein [Novosphingobium sp.]|nr:PH domain-containing protein [Novosphingobium sp.]MBO9601359.1 PH domain-containing protein [Novosphingobium sp.]
MDAIRFANPFQPYLLPGERILWSGRPKQGLVLRGADALLIPFSLLWGGFAIFWNIGVWTFPATGQSIDWFMRLWGLPFLVVGLYMILGRFLHDLLLRRQMAYAVTDQRILVLSGLLANRLSSLDVHWLPKLQLSEHRDGTGTIELEGDDSALPFFYRRQGMGTWTPALGRGTQLFRIEEPRWVYDLIRKQAQRS